jgi:hypothetical protein
MDVLAAERRIAERHGGWDKVGASHLQRANDAKAWLTQRRKRLWHMAKEEANGWEKGHRRERYELIKAATRD